MLTLKELDSLLYIISKAKFDSEYDCNMKFINELKHRRYTEGVKQGKIIPLGLVNNYYKDDLYKSWDGIYFLKHK